MEKNISDADSVKLQCEQDWKQLKAVQAELQGITALPPGGTNNADGDVNSALLHILHEHEKRLKAEIQVLQDRELKTLPENADLQRLILEQDQLKRLDQLKDTLTFLRAKRSEVLEEIKQEEEAFSSLNDLHSTLKAKMADVVDQEASAKGGGALGSVLTNLALKVKKVSETDRHFKHSLKQILQKQYPLHDNIVDDPLDESRDVDMDNLLPLRTIVGKLIEQSLNSPEQPYIEIDEQFWPRHIEFLLRCQIVLKDPQNSRRIKLVPFHL